MKSIEVIHSENEREAERRLEINRKAFAEHHAELRNAMEIILRLKDAIELVSVPFQHSDQVSRAHRDAETYLRTMSDQYGLGGKLPAAVQGSQIGTQEASGG